MGSAAQSNVSYSNSLFKRYLMELIDGIIWKNSVAAMEAEPNDTTEAYRSELFVVANRGLLNFDVIKSVPRAVLLNSGVPERYVEAYASDKYLIPKNIRGKVIEEYTRALTSKNPTTGRYEYFNNVTGQYEELYHESNNYYRMLNGLPDEGDTDFVYNKDRRWPTDVPVHLMTYVQRLEMERAGVTAELAKKYPEKKYLNHMGKKSIDFFKARIAGKFEILWRNDCPSDNLNNDFDTAYNLSKEQMLSVYYSNALRKTNEYYENFLAMCIVFMTLEFMQHQYLKADISRDFYDTESLKVIYDSYSVPFYSEIPLEYHRKIVKNMNKLLACKGSNRVFLDLFDIFDLGSMQLYSYFLTKFHKFDETGNPTFIIQKDEEGNDMYDKDGYPILDPINYELKFSKVDLYGDPALAVSDKKNDVKYEIITAPDPYWVDDFQLKEKLKEASFNYRESKYLGIQIIFSLMQITYENAYLFRMITDNAKKTNGIQMEFRWAEMNVTCTIFDIFIYLAALYCKYFGYEGVINPRIPAVMDTLGYNFEESMQIIQEDILKNPILSKDKALLDLVLNMDFNEIKELNGIYDNIVDIRRVIANGYINAKTIPEFHAYRDLYNSLMISKEITDTYTDPETGEIYETFESMLGHCSPDLMKRYILMETKEQIEPEITVVIDEIEALMPSIKYLPFSLEINSSKLIEALFKILKFFKSAKAELLEYNITYIIAMRGVSFIKLMDKMELFKGWYWLKDYSLYFIDFLHRNQSELRGIKDILMGKDKLVSYHYYQKLYDAIDKLIDKWLAYEYRTWIKDEYFFTDLLMAFHSFVKSAVDLHQMKDEITRYHQSNGMCIDKYKLEDYLSKTHYFTKDIPHEYTSQVDLLLALSETFREADYNGMSDKDEIEMTIETNPMIADSFGFNMMLVSFKEILEQLTRDELINVDELRVHTSARRDGVAFTMTDKDSFMPHTRDVCSDTMLTADKLFENIDGKWVEVK